MKKLITSIILTLTVAVFITSAEDRDISLHPKTPPNTSGRPRIPARDAFECFYSDEAGTLYITPNYPVGNFRVVLTDMETGISIPAYESPGAGLAVYIQSSFTLITVITESGAEYEGELIL